MRLDRDLEVEPAQVDADAPELGDPGQAGQDGKDDDADRFLHTVSSSMWIVTCRSCPELPGGAHLHRW